MPFNYSEFPEEQDCTCWVADEPDDVRFAIHYGAHNPDCPRYRESLDPVDKANDEDLRLRKERL